jgi:tetratricopeptide (TPR) repeat protein
LRAGSEATLSQTEWSATSFLPNIDDAIAVARYMTEPHRSAEFRAVGNTVLASLYMGKGEWQEAQAHLGAAAALDPAGALVNRALMELAPFREIDPITLRGLRTELRAFDAASVPPAVSPTIWIAAHNGLYPELRGYLLGLLNGQLRDTAITLRDLSSFEPPPGLGTAAADWRRGVLASAALAAGDIDGALVQLEAVELESWYQLVVVSPFVAMSRERFLLATLLEEAGRTDEALMWYGSFEHSSPHDRMYVAPSHLRRGRIHQRLGNHEIAADHYRAFIDLWRDADPEFQSMVEEAQARLGDVVDDER